MNERLYDTLLFPQLVDPQTGGVQLAAWTDVALLDGSSDPIGAVSQAAALLLQPLAHVAAADGAHPKPLTRAELIRLIDSMQKENTAILETIEECVAAIGRHAAYFGASEASEAHLAGEEADDATESAMTQAYEGYLQRREAAFKADELQTHATGMVYLPEDVEFERGITRRAVFEPQAQRELVADKAARLDLF